MRFDSNAAAPVHPIAIEDACLHAAEAYPRECCGLIHRSGRVRRCQNIAGRPDRFELSADDVLAMFESLEGARGDPVEAIYHSHCDADAEMSAADRVGLAGLIEAAGMDRPPTQVIIACRGGCATSAVPYTWHLGDWRPAAGAWRRPAPEAPADALSRMAAGEISQGIFGGPDSKGHALSELPGHFP
jgi:proteasome lid subunit RPN8/RPN11